MNTAHWLSRDSMVTCTAIIHQFEMEIKWIYFFNKLNVGIQWLKFSLLPYIHFNVVIG